MNLIDKVLSRKEFKDRPLVLIDIGASGEIHQKWKRISKYAYCIAFDADSRDFNIEGESNKAYRKLFVKNALVSTGRAIVDFHLTKSPYCSSTLLPRTNKLKDWAFAPLFEVEKTIQLQAVDLNSVLEELKLDYVDWYKSDSQGTDLRLFASLQQSIQSKVIAAEFEPGILDAYQGEDKLHLVLSYMDSIEKFWLANLEVKGTMRIPYNRLRDIFKMPFLQRLTAKVGQQAPGWGEMTYLSNFEQPTFTIREFLAGWVFSTLLNQHGFAYDLASRGLEMYSDKLFEKLKNSSRTQIMFSLVNTKYLSIIRKKAGF